MAVHDGVELTRLRHIFGGIGVAARGPSQAAPWTPAPRRRYTTRLAGLEPEAFARTMPVPAVAPPMMRG